ncbi:MAG: chromosome segregation protein SMC [Thermoguttaceae bacterium]|jgi:chromosome segregation protein
MLKALELVGFKSFADRTRFEFPPGITVVVGPNGSGKSNVVDAIKWVLGEQSVKSLRGKEMADVIFNGSGARRAINTAEITLTVDNSKHLLPIDTAEVHITRRVYRSGEGEYLINRNPARLRDIRDLLSGTGMGTQAYSVIEQGKVDILLQSSARDRRIIFEEAAGISRFKLRKIEALRRLERVDQNLLRLHDIVDEVENRLRSVRAQAGKARRYKEYYDRLQELRTQVGLVDWRRLTERLSGFEQEIQSLADERDSAAASAETIEARLLEIETQSGEINEAIRGSEGRIASDRERIAAGESSIEHERARLKDLEEEIARSQKQIVAMNARTGDLEKELGGTADERTAAEELHRQIGRRLVEAERELTDVMAVLDQLRGENQQRRAGYMQQMRSSADLGNETGALETQVAAASATTQRCQARLEEFARQINALQSDLTRLHAQRDETAGQLDEQDRRLADAREQIEQVQRQLSAKQAELGGLRQRHSGAVERSSVLEELVRRQEGLSAGVKEILARAADPADGPFRNVFGLLADLLNVSVEAAPLIEIALGQAAQHVVASPGHDLMNFLHKESNRLAGRVGFIWLDGRNEEPAAAGVNLDGRPGVLGRADRFVETQSRFAPLARRLLSRTWIVEKLSHAIELAENCPVGLSFVALSGELLQADGTLVVGPRHGSTGLITRRSELRALRVQLEELKTAVAAAESAVAGFEAQIDRHQKAAAVSEKKRQQAADHLAELQILITTAEERRAQLDQQKTVQGDEFAAAQDQHAAASQRLIEARRKRSEIDRDLADSEQKLELLGEQISRLENQRMEQGRQTTEIKVELAKSEERLHNLGDRLSQLDENRQERYRAIDESRQHLAESTHRAETARWNILHAESEVAELYIRKESYASQTVTLINRREELLAQRSELTADIQKIRAKIRKFEDKIHAQDLSANEVRHERSTLADRMREDYGIELAELEHDPDAEEQHKREEVQQEIDDLRRKIANLGNVNIEALEELRQLETRDKTLSDQYRDLADAKASLEKIIDKINTDSRRLFTETLDTIRGHFQQLFRDLFGGGHADIVLEEGVDILDSGIEIVARPPGKEPRNISLLSGGEKTLTCAAMLLAIFRSRPSPFCVLDEVDAALDEANIDRFIKVLKDFLAWTQFIIVTHSKKTMTCANTIYGVTMQESGVSKQVSVRFEDVSDDGHIKPERLAAEKDTRAA